MPITRSTGPNATLARNEAAMTYLVEALIPANTRAANETTHRQWDDRHSRGPEEYDEAIADYLTGLFERGGKSADTCALTLATIRYRAKIQSRPDPAGSLTVADTAVDADGSRRIHVRASKTDKTGEGCSLYLGPCAVQRIVTWLESASIQDGPLFRRIARGATGKVGSDAINVRSDGRILRTRAEAAGLEGRLTSHSVRVGSAQSLVSCGATLAEAQRDGR